MFASLLIGLAVAAPPAAARPFGQGVELVMFTAPSCSVCQEMKPVVRRLRQRGYSTWLADSARPRNVAWLRNQQLTRLPAWIVYRDGRAVGRSEGRWSEATLAKWLDSFVPETPPATGPLADPLNWRAYQRGHTPTWTLSPGTCGMYGCAVHGGGWQMR